VSGDDAVGLAIGVLLLVFMLVALLFPDRF
jgi:K+-transporting ATPase KdpF subunit